MAVLADYWLLAHFKQNLQLVGSYLVSYELSVRCQVLVIKYNVLLWAFFSLDRGAEGATRPRRQAPGWYGKRPTPLGGWGRVDRACAALRSGRRRDAMWLLWHGHPARR